MFRAYAPFKAFAAAAGTHTEVWRIPITVVVMICCVIALQMGIYSLTFMGAGEEAANQTLAEMSGQGVGARAVLVVLFALGFRAIGLILAVRVLHERGLVSLLGPPPQAVREGLKVFLWVAGLLVALAIILPQDASPVRNEAMPFGRWLMLLPIALTAIFVQVFSEELLFRGYLQQQIGARFQMPLVYIGVPALFFALGHGGATAGDNALLFILWAGAFGLAAGDLTARTGSLGASIGLHLANNCMALLGVSLLGPVSGLALWHLPLMPDDPALQGLLLPEFISLFCTWLVARLALRV